MTNIFKIAVVGDELMREKYVNKLSLITSIPIEKIGQEEIVKGEMYLNETETVVTYISSPTDLSIEEIGYVLLFVSESTTQQTLDKLTVKIKSLIDESTLFAYCETNREINGVLPENIIPSECKIIDMLSLINVVKTKGISLDLVYQFYQLNEQTTQQQEKQQTQQSQHYQIHSQEKRNESYGYTLADLERFENDSHDSYDSNDSNDSMENNDDNNDTSDDEKRTEMKEKKQKKRSKRNIITERELLFGEESSGEEEEVHWSDEEALSKQTAKEEK